MNAQRKRDLIASIRQSAAAVVAMREGEALCPELAGSPEVNRHCELHALAAQKCAESLARETHRQTTIQEQAQALGRGEHCVDLAFRGRTRRALLDVRPRGKVRILIKPEVHDMYTSWREVEGNALGRVYNVIVWAARDPALMDVFNREPVAVLHVRERTP